MGRKREEPPEAVVDEGFDVAPEFKFDDTPDTDEDDSGDYGC